MNVWFELYLVGEYSNSHSSNTNTPLAFSNIATEHILCLFWWDAMEDRSESNSEDTDSSVQLSSGALSSKGLDLVQGDVLGMSAAATNSNRGFREVLHKVGSSGNLANEVAESSVAVTVENGNVNLRQWLDKPERSVNVVECLHIFRQIVEILNFAHSQGIVVHNARPSCFIVSSLNRVSFLEPLSCSSRNSDLCGDALKIKIAEGQCSSPFFHKFHNKSCRMPCLDSNLDLNSPDASQMHSGTSSLQSGSQNAKHLSLVGESEERNDGDSRNLENVEESKKHLAQRSILHEEISWYASPEEIAGASGSFSSDIYRLGVLLFELFCSFCSTEEKLSTMTNLRHRVLPPQMLLKWPKEASFCLWLLHPQSSTRPKMSDLLQSEFLNEPREEHEVKINLREEIEEQELLLDFLLQMQQRKTDSSNKLLDTICWLSSDIEEVLMQQSNLKNKGASDPQPNKNGHPESKNPVLQSWDVLMNEDLACSGPRKSFKQEVHVSNEERFVRDLDDAQKSDTLNKNQERVRSKSKRLMKNIKKLESVYISTRCRMTKSTGNFSNRCSEINSNGRGSNVISGRSSVDNFGFSPGNGRVGKHGWINPFLEGLNNYLSFSNLKIRADLKQGDFLNSSNLVCSLSFDRDKEFFASAGVARKIKVYEYDIVLNGDRGIHCPVIEMASKSMISSICWNSYIKSQIASSDFEGAVQIWDVNRGQVLTEMMEHERRVWSVDFSSADPTMLASGSDDGSVKLWNINQGESIDTIKTKANVCCVQFPPDSARSLVFGSADHKIYCYDLRNTKTPWCTMLGHTRTVSYIKFVDSASLVSASTDNTLKLWDLSTCTSQVLNNPLQTFTGHRNVKNFVGLSVWDGYIATGSETDEVFIYHKAFPMPMLSFKFSSMDALSCHEEDDATQFVSSVCWQGKSPILVAANSAGNIKLLQMI
ncbi:Spa1-related [Thalictrum thalictroides]|uniref:Spa1-related n=1 Tax=Thalictrum thalictroides TaxID=46969 RepID=A0A7J6VAW8_THATH|nr:Spa1-related [Thalictrum thalictroides]